MAEKFDLKVGQVIYFRSIKLNKIISGKIIKLNPTRAKVELNSNKSKWNVPYRMISTGLDQEEVNGEKFIYQKSDITTNLQLYELLSDVRDEYENVFEKIFNHDQHMKKERVKIFFGNRITYNKAGHYSTVKNEIYITNSYKKAPIKAIKFVIYHELLHIKWKGSNAHCPAMRMHEKMNDDYKFAKDFMSKLFKSIRIHGNDAFNFKESSKPEPKKTEIPKKAPAIKPKPKVEVKKPESDIDKRWKEIRAKNKKIQKPIKEPLKPDIDERWKRIQAKKQKFQILT